MPARSDEQFVQILDRALGDAAERSGNWLACRPGCNACCHGVFAISALDADRLQRGYLELLSTDPARAIALQQRVGEAQSRLASDYPGDLASGQLGEDDESAERFADFANDERCPVLNPQTGTCDLYAHRPVTCRIFGPPVRSEEGLGVCELCFQGAPEQEIARCEVQLPDPSVEEELTKPLGEWKTIVAFALRT